MKNTLGDLNNHLFAELERLSDEELRGDELVEEMGRARTITEVSTQIILNAHVILKAEKFRDEKLDVSRSVPKMLEG
ncbi:hypothetical protein [uncultured Peptoniphilus sp.]|uniref:hypothetical protein n=1 Tax=uncultured Peptoniphilus sp. TaxID=254354 RepID=UPI0025992538|nr:hypothetical protein [uncultured Peptoniphilus sp.]